MIARVTYPRCHQSGKNPNSAQCYNDYAPGGGYQYCNLNFNLAGTILERLSGERFDRVCETLRPLDPLVSMAVIVSTSSINRGFIDDLMSTTAIPPGW